MKSNAILPLSAFVVASTVTFADLSKTGKPPDNRQWVGMAAVYLILSIGADLGFAPVNGFAGLMMVAVFLSRGQEALGYLNTKTGPPKNSKGRFRQQPQRFEPVEERRI